MWLKHWSEINQKYGGNPNVGKYIGIYFAFGVGSAALVVVQTLILWIFCSIEVRYLAWRALRGMHDTNKGCRLAGSYTNEWHSPYSVLQ